MPELLGADPADCLVLEDVPAGIAAGRAAGSLVVAVATTFPVDRLAAADAVVFDLHGVAEALDGLGYALPSA